MEQSDTLTLGTLGTLAHFSHCYGLADGGGDHGLDVFQFGIGRDIAAGLQNKPLRAELPDQAGAVLVNIIRIV